MADLEESGIYNYTCPRGHSTAFCLQNFKFELLFDLGLQAIADGYLREAVSSFAGALERFFEFFVEVTLVGAGVGPEVFAKAWKPLAKMSERQLGAFAMLYTRDEGAAPPLLDEKQTELRNAVIHKGRFPSLEEAIAFGRAVLNIIRPCLKKLRARLGDRVQAMRDRLLAKLRASAQAGFSPVNLYQMTFISASEENDRHQFDIQEQVDAIRNLRDEPPA